LYAEQKLTFILAKYFLPLMVAVSLVGCTFTDSLLNRAATPVSVNFFTPTPVSTVGAPVTTPAVAARVNGTPIFLDTVLQEVALFKQSLAQEEVDGTPPAATQIKDQVLSRLIDQLIIEQQAGLLGLSVSEEDVAISAQAIRNKAESQAEFETWLLTNRLTEQQFLRELETELTTRRLYDQITADVPVQTDQARVRYLWVVGRDLAQEIENWLVNQIEFDQIIEEQINNNPGLSESGQLNWFPLHAGLLPAEVETLVFRSQPGEIVGPIFVSDRYYFVEVEGIEKDRPLTLDRQQALKKQVFLRWLRQKRLEAQIERPVTLN
jgi:parvulin-like peptidyl-prolyl isomerase